MIPRLTLYVPARLRKPKPAPAVQPYPPQAAMREPRTPPPATPIPARADLATATRYGPIPAPDEQHHALGIAWRMAESERLALLAELGGDLAAHQAVQAETEQPKPRQG